VVDPNLGLGIVLVAFVLLVPQGIVPMVRDRLLPARRQPAPRDRPSTEAAEVRQ
jgi:hypothetical protein